MPEQNLTQVLDRLAIRELIDEYSNCVNERDWTRLGTLFAEDGAWRTRGTGTERDFEGNAAVVAAISAAVSRAEMCVQLPSAAKIRLDGDTATATSMLNEIVRLNSQEGKFLYGVYHDRLARGANGWLFQERIFKCTYILNAPLPGDLILMRAGRPAP